MFLVALTCLMYTLTLKRSVHFTYHLPKLCYNIKRSLSNFPTRDTILIIVDGMNSKYRSNRNNIKREEKFLIENKTDSVNFTKIKHILIFLLYCNHDIKSKE